MNQRKRKVRVLVVEDSPSYRELLVTILQNDPDLQVIGTARDGAEGVRLTKRLKPDIITMDIHMPEMDGFEATRQIMAEHPCPIVMISASLNKNERNLSFDAIQAGALSVFEKPTVHTSPDICEYLTFQIKLMSEVKVIRRWNGNKPKKIISSIEYPPIKQRKSQSKIQLVAIASSTGGPGALSTILSQLPADFSVPILIVQHITPGFGEGLATWLNQQTPLTVRIAQQADEPKVGQVLIAPDNHHMEINSMGLISLNKRPFLNGVRPSADYLFQSVARVYGSTAIGVVLTGMGRDGATGLEAMHQLGAYTIAQNKETSVVFGMPAVAIELNAIEKILPIQQIAQMLINLV